MIIQQLDAEHVLSTYKLVHETIFNLPTYSRRAAEDQIRVYTIPNLLEHITNPDRLSIIATEKDEVVGFLFGVIERLPNDNVFYLEWNGVNPTYRSKGIMQMMWDVMDVWVKDKNLDGILVDTLINNTKMIRFLQKNKMNIWKEMKNHWYGHDIFLWGKLYGKPDGQL
jgi:ribosomal protein S18 acetylase RimI-like enzyme